MKFSEESGLLQRRLKPQFTIGHNSCSYLSAHPCFPHNFQKIKNCAQTSGLKTVDEVRADLMVLDLLDHFFGNVGIAEGGIDEVFQAAATTVLLSGGNILD